MDSKLKKILRGISLEIRRLLEGRYDEHGQWQGGDLERRLNELGVWRDRNAKPVEELPHLSPEDKSARRLVDGYLKLREEAGVGQEAAVSEFVRESAYTWANRLFALRCMEARGIIDEVIHQKEVYGGRSMVHSRLAKKNPGACAGDDDGLFTLLFTEFEQRTQELPALFDPKSPAVALRPSVASLKKTIALLSGRETARGQDAATDEVFAAPDAFGWAYQYWNADEKDRVFEMVRTKKGAKIEGADIIPATQLYTEPYMVKFLVQNSLGALWMGMYPDSKLCEHWEYFVRDADRAPVTRKPVGELTFLDPAQGSGHFHLEAFDLFYAMYVEEAERDGRTLTTREICAGILNHNLYGIDIDGRSVQIATAALWMKAKERAPELEASNLTTFHDHLVATNIRLPKGKDHLQLFLKNHPEDEPLRPALELVFQGLEHADELGALLQIEELVDDVLRRLKEESDKSKGVATQPGLFEKTLVQGTLAVSVKDYDKWKRDALNRLQTHFESEAKTADAVQAFFGESAGKGLTFFDVLSRRYDVVTANPPYMGGKNMGAALKAYVGKYYSTTKSDLYSIFIARCKELALDGGRVAMVTRKTWVFVKTFEKLRLDLLNTDRIELICDLGSRAFDPETKLHDGVDVCLFVFARDILLNDARIVSFRIVAPDGPEQKQLLMLKAIKNKVLGVNYAPKQQQFLLIPFAPIAYWANEEILRLLDPTEFSRIAPAAFCAHGLGTRCDFRTVRMTWEIACKNDRWFVYSKGGKYCKWFGANWFIVDYHHGGRRIRSYLNERFPYLHGNFAMLVADESVYLRDGLCYSEVARKSLGVRKLPSRAIPGHRGPGIYMQEGVDEFLILTFLNCRLHSFLYRLLVPHALLLDYSYFGILPGIEVLDNEAKNLLTLIGRVCFKLKVSIVSSDLREESFLVSSDSSKNFAQSAMLHSLEGFAEDIIFKQCKITSETLNAIIFETGLPAGALEIIGGYDELPLQIEGSSLLKEAFSVFLKTRFVPAGNGQNIDAIKKMLKSIYECEIAVPEDNDNELSSDEIQEPEADEVNEANDSRLFIPNETLIEELAQKLRIHPISIYWLLKEGIEHEGWRCLPEEQRIAEDRFTVLVLRLLGHRWPKQLETGEPLPAWSDLDGVIPLTSGGGETPLVDRVRKRLAEDFLGGNVAALQQEFEVIVGTPMESWLAGPFFDRHISQFKKRPIAWHLETEVRSRIPETKGKGNAKKGPKSPPVFACLLYYHKLNAGLLPKIRTHYVGILKEGYETELRTLERMANRTADQEGRRLQLDAWIEEMKAFDAKLEQITSSGFGPASLRPALRQYAINDALLSLMACWLKKLNDVAASGPVEKWQAAAATTDLHDDLPLWIGNAFARLDFFCAAVGPKAPEEKSLATDPTSKDLAPLICARPAETVGKVLELACDRWWQNFEDAVLTPLKEALKQAREEQDRVKEELELDEVKRDYARGKKLGDRRDELKKQIKDLREDIDVKTDTAKRLRREIESWTCPDAATWEKWLGTKSLFDEVAGLDGERVPPATIAEFVVQESIYAPDINDGVRVNIAPLQKAGLLHADVLDSKDADKAISDRAEWRADERRWVREGKLPQPGWWETTKNTI